VCNYLLLAAAKNILLTGIGEKAAESLEIMYNKSLHLSA
jgi:hypothetical protein